MKYNRKRVYNRHKVAGYIRDFNETKREIGESIVQMTNGIVVIISALFIFWLFMQIILFFTN